MLPHARQKTKVSTRSKNWGVEREGACGLSRVASAALTEMSA